MRKITAMFLALQLLLVPAAGFAEGIDGEAASGQKPSNLQTGIVDPAGDLLPSSTSADDKYAVISNESTDGETAQPTGTFDLKSMSYTYNKSLKPSAYKLNIKKPFDVSSHQGKFISKNTKLMLSAAYNVGDRKYFWVTNLSTETDYQINARLAYSGSKANVWVYNNLISDADAAKMGAEFDNKIYPSVTNNFGFESDVNGDGKINILCYDILDDYPNSNSYVGGYFWAGDLYNIAHSNLSEIFYVDTFPSMGAGSKKDVTQAYETLSHEFQHMVNFNQNVLIEGSSNEMDVWLDEGLAMASEQAYTGKGLQDRVDYYNVSNAIRNGQSLLYWDQDGDLLSNYSLSYLFMQYVKIQTGQGNKIFKEILRDSNNNYKAVENVAKKYINPNMTFGKLMTSFRIALLLKEPTGLYGFKGDPFFYQLKERIFTGSSANLRGGGAVVTTFQTINGFAIPVNKGANVTYIFMDRDITPPSSPVVNRVGDSDLKITGTSEPFSVVYAKVGQTEIGRTASSSTGVFSIPISSNRAAGTAVQVFAKDASGNVSTASIVTVQDLTAPKRPIVNAVIENKPVVTGQAEPGSKVEVRLGESLLGEGTAGADGSFSIAIPPQKAGVTLTVTASDVYGYVSEKATIMVKPVLAGWVKSGSSWYYYDPVSGKIATGWLKLGSAWYYLNGNGVMQTGWELVTGKWYYFADSGAMKVGWLKSGTSWYYLGADGAMQTGWLSLGGKWYYLYSDGRMAASTTINGYHLGSNGVWIR